MWISDGLAQSLFIILLLNKIDSLLIPFESGMIQRNEKKVILLTLSVLSYNLLIQDRLCVSSPIDQAV